MKTSHLFLIILLLISCNLKAQNENDNLKIITEEEKKELIDSIGKLLSTNYIFPDTANSMVALLNKKKLLSEDYTDIDDGIEFANVLTQDLFSVSKDKHLRVIYEHEMIGKMKKNKKFSQEEKDSITNLVNENMKKKNFGFKEVKMLDEHIGYINLMNFFPAEFGRETAVKAMAEVSTAKALVIDLRYNTGGSPSMIQLLTSYFYEGEPIHLNTFYWRPTDEYTETWTLADVPGKRMPDVDLYILTSKKTFSAAEEFTYNLKNLNRATIIGETTGGGAHPGGKQMATEKFSLWIPKGRAINPVTNTNWEGTGVTPDIAVSMEMALEVALKKARETLDK